MEVEMKFAVPDEETYERLASVDELGGCRLAEAVERQLQDTYFDTADAAVAAAGYTLRRRDWDDIVTVTLKQIPTAAAARAGDAVMRREELEVDLVAAAAEGTRAADGRQGEGAPSPADGLRVEALPPGPLRRRLAEMVGTRPLQTVLKLAQRRVARDAVAGERSVAEVSLDTVTVQTPAGAHRYHELEIEMRPQATEEDLRTLSSCLAGQWGLRPERASKFARAQALLAQSRASTASEAEAREPEAAGMEAGPTAGDGAAVSPTVAAAPATRAETEADTRKETRRKSPGIEPDDLMSEAARKTILFHFQRMLDHEKGTRAGKDYEELHDMRVATRRMRAALAVFGPYVDERAYRPYLKSLRRTGRLLGAVRDLDVFHEKAERYLQSLPEERRDELDALFQAWRVEREQRRERMLAWLDGDGFRGFVDSFGEFLQSPGAGAVPDFDADGAPLGRRVNLALPPVVLTELANVLAYDEWVTGSEVPLSRLHQLRIAGKYLRYTLEFFSDVLGPGGKLVIHTVKTLQDHLGDLQDAVVTSAILRDFLSGRGWGRLEGKRARAEQGTDLIVAPGVANYLAYKQMELERLVHTFPEVWEPVRAPRYRHTLLSLLGKL